MVEGYTDVLALHQAGIRESVAIMGTALTAEQMRRARARRRPWCCSRSTPTAPARRRCCAPRALAQDRGVELRVVEMPEGKDPADLLAAGGGSDSWSGSTGRSQ